MRAWMIAFSLGIMFGVLLPSLPEERFYPLLFIPLLLSFISAWILPKLRLIAAFCLGLLWFLYSAGNSLQQVLPATLERQDIWVQGNLASQPENNTRNTSFIFRVRRACAVSALEQCEFRNDLLADQLIQLRSYQELTILPGQSWQFKVRLKRPHGFLNPGGFDYEAWLWQKRIRATGYVRADAGNRLLGQADGTFFLQQRHRFAAYLSGLFPAPSLPHSGLILALSIGDRRGLDTSQWQLFSATGTTHLMVISGMHVGLVSLLIYHLSMFAIKRSTCLILYIPAQRIAALITLGAAYFYAGMAGFGLPAQRAFIMIAAFMLGQCCCRHTNVSNSFFLALALVLLINPLAPLSSGFWLSFVAVAVLIFFTGRQTEPGGQGMLRSLYRLFKIQLLVFLGLLPFMLWLFQQSSLSAPLVNMLAIPYVSVLLVPLCLSILLLSFISDQAVILLAYLTDRLLDFFIQGLAAVDHTWPSALFELPALNLWSWLFLLSATAFLLHSPVATRPRLWLTASLCCLLPLLLSSGAERLEHGEVQVDFLDVGQGLAVVLRTRNHVLLYDLGPAYSNDFNAGDGIIQPFLKAQNIRRPDRVIVSHGDNDHAGGLISIKSSFPGTEFLASDLSTFSDADTASYCRAGQNWNWDGVNFAILHPQWDGYRGNNASCVLKVSTARHTILLTGDIESRVERQLLGSDIKLDADILLAPHHGSRTSSSPDFIEAVSPVYVVFSSGYLNQFSHPHPDIVNLYTNSGTITLNTATTGTISWLLGNKDSLPEPILYRQEHKRFWRMLR